MKIILGKEDIEDLVKKFFKGVNTVELKTDSKGDVSIELDVDKDLSSTIPIQTGIIVKNVNALASTITEEPERKLVTIKPQYTSEEQRKKLEQAEQLNQMQNDRTLTSSKQFNNYSGIGRILLVNLCRKQG